MADDRCRGTGFVYGWREAKNGFGMEPCRVRCAGCLDCSETEDMWRVDVAGYACRVRGRGAKEHLERVNGQLARMKMALHKIAKVSSRDGCNLIAMEALSHE